MPPEKTIEARKRFTDAIEIWIFKQICAVAMQIALYTIEMALQLISTTADSAAHIYWASGQSVRTGPVPRSPQQQSRRQNNEAGRRAGRESVE